MPDIFGVPTVAEQFQEAGLIDQYGQVITSPEQLAASRGSLSGAPQPPQNKGTGVKAGAEAALMFVDDALSPVAKKVQLAALNATGGIGAGGKAAGVMGHLGRAAGSNAFLTAAKVGTGIGALNSVLGAADILTGQDSAANKVMDTAAMGIGGFLGAAGGPMGIAAGAGIGKAVSDGAQFIFGGGKSAEQRRMEEALAALRGGRI